MKYKPRGDLLLVKRLEIKEEKVAGGIILPGQQMNRTLSRFLILLDGVSALSSDLKAGNVVIAEDMMVELTANGENGFLNQKYIHAVEENYGSNN
jgi:co-chaperonin GroES (HSP10)